MFRAGCVLGGSGHTDSNCPDCIHASLPEGLRVKSSWRRRSKLLQAGDLFVHQFCCASEPAFALACVAAYCGALPAAAVAVAAVAAGPCAAVAAVPAAPHAAAAAAHAAVAFAHCEPLAQEAPAGDGHCTAPGFCCCACWACPRPPNQDFAAAAAAESGFSAGADPGGAQMVDADTGREIACGPGSVWEGWVVQAAAAPAVV
eukprot:1155018-Pelagomonas_calceolata.AAC.5